MAGKPEPDFTGRVRNFSSAMIDNDKVRYFEFALVLPQRPGDTYPVEVVLYVDLKQGNAQEIVSAVTSAWALDRTALVYLKLGEPKMRVAKIELQPSRRAKTSTQAGA